MINTKELRGPGSRTVSLLLAAALAFCAVVPLAADGLSGPLVGSSFPAADKLSPFAKTALDSLSTFQLSNGIPVVVRKNDASPIRHLELVLRGGAAASTPATAGYELLALKTMLRASSDYSYVKIQGLLDETSAGMGAAASLDYSAYTLTCLDKYYDRLFPAWASTLTKPLFDGADFGKVLSDAKLAWQSKEKDPWARTGRQMNNIFFEGHPYLPATDGTKESLDAASLDAVKAWYSKSFSADRIFIVAAGDFDPATLRKELDAALGSIPNLKAGYPASLPPLVAKGGITKVEHAQSKGVAYVRGDFAAPSPSSEEFMPMNIAMAMYSDLLTNVVREKYGAVYTPGAYIRAMAANYGSITMFKTNKAGQIKNYIDEATADLAAGKTTTTDTSGSKDSSPRTTIEAALPIYKAQYSNSYFLKLQKNSQVADMIAQSIIAQGDCRAWILDQQRIDAVTADQVKAAVAKYLLGGKITWVVLGSADTYAALVDADYGKLGTN